MLDSFLHLNLVVPHFRQLVTCDQNTVPFPLPKFVDDNRKTIRQWARSWVIFDCHVPTGGAWYMLPLHEYGKVTDTLTPDKIYRASYRPGTFYTDITGEAAWGVLPIGVVGNNITTPEQDSIWQQRSKRKDYIHIWKHCTIVFLVKSLFSSVLKVVSFL
jgi:hypothetical protein